MKTTWKGTAAVLLLAGGPWLASAVQAEPSPTLHLALEQSSPSADEVVAESPASVTLWFTQAPQMSGTSVRVVPDGGEPLDLGKATAKEDDPSVIVLEIGSPLADGGYRVMWRAMAGDGHTVRGDFRFTVRAGR